MAAGALAWTAFAYLKCAPVYAKIEKEKKRFCRRWRCWHAAVQQEKAYGTRAPQLKIAARVQHGKFGEGKVKKIIRSLNGQQFIWVKFSQGGKEVRISAGVGQWFSESSQIKSF